MIRITIPILLCGLMMLTSCVKEELSSGSVVEGKPTLIKFSLSASYKNESPLTRVVITKEDEKKFKDIRVLIFDSKEMLVTNKKVSYPVAETAPELTIDTYSGKNRTIYVVANMVDTLDRRLAVVNTKSELLTMQTTIKEFNNGISGKPLLMTAVRENLDILPGGKTKLSLQMAFMTAKVTLVVKDKTPTDNSVTILGWGVLNGASNSYVIPKETLDANADKLDQDEEWTTSPVLMKFDKTENDPEGSSKQKVTVTQYLFENRRKGRVDHQPLPPGAYPDMAVGDSSHMGKAWFAPKRATAFVIYAMHKTPTESKVIEAKIFIGGNAINDYNIERGKHYTFTVTIEGIDSIKVDTNLEHLNENFVVQTSAPLEKMDAHPDFRPFMIKGIDGVASIEILDMSDKTYSQGGFAAKWVKVSPLNLMYHQVRQAAGSDTWQQQAGVKGSFVRAKYIPHKSVREILAKASISGWNPIPNGQDDDDNMTFANATHRMCYKITDIPFAVGAVTSKTLCVYTDEFLEKKGTRRAKVKVSFQPKGSKEIEVRIFTITQKGYLSIFNETDQTAGLAVLNEDGTPSGVKRRFGIEQFEEVDEQMNLSTVVGTQEKNYMQWGFSNYGKMLYNENDKYRNGYYVTAKDVYGDVTRSNNQPISFGKSYLPMYGHGQLGNYNAIPEYKGTTSSSPYYYPDAAANIYHPIYKSSAARYCHEKNRDMNGDGFIDASETKWYLPSQHELLLLWIDGTVPFPDKSYWSTTESHRDSSLYVTMNLGYSKGALKNNEGIRVRCIRGI